jgi:predicted Holliday junction resolvase-like endonuclease
MQADLVFVMLVFSILAIIFVISRLNEAIKLLHNRVNMHSNLLKKFKKAKKGAPVDDEELIKQILDKDFS